MEQEVESPVPVSAGYLYWNRVGEMRENVKRDDVDDGTLSI